MADIGHEHLHHMAKKLHHLNEKHDGLMQKISGYAGRAIETLETGAGAWAGGVVEGRFDGASLMGVPYNLLAGVAMLAASHVKQFDKVSEHLNNLGNGFVGSYAAAVGYKFGKNWKDHGLKLWGGHSFHPYELPTGDAKTSGELSQDQMASIVQRMQQAAASQQP